MNTSLPRRRHERSINPPHGPPRTGRLHDTNLPFSRVCTRDGGICYYDDDIGRKVHDIRRINILHLYFAQSVTSRVKRVRQTSSLQSACAFLSLSAYMVFTRAPVQPKQPSPPAARVKPLTRCTLHALHTTTVHLGIRW